MPKSNVVSFERDPKVIAKEARIWAARVLMRASKLYGPEQKVMLFRTMIPPPHSDILKEMRDILIKNIGYENVEWVIHEHFMWDIIVYRIDPPLLELKGETRESESKK